MAQEVRDTTTGKNESIRHAADTIQRSKDRKKVFEKIYKGPKPIKTVSEIMSSTQLSRVRVLQEGKKLVQHHIVEQIKINQETAYQKVSFYTANKNKILNLAENPHKKSKYPTRQEPKISLTGIIKIKIPSGIPKPRYSLINIDEIDSFDEIKKVIAPKKYNFDSLPEEKIKIGFQKILAQEGKFKDWGGENNDLYSGKLKYKSRKYAAAFAFKGKATKGTLKPNMMGKNGDQVGRLFRTPATFFFVVYPRIIHESIVTQMQAFALAEAMTGKPVFYCVIGGEDFARIYQAYQKYFK